MAQDGQDRRAPVVAVADGSRDWEFAFRRLVAHACHHAIEPRVRECDQIALANLNVVKSLPACTDRDRLIVDITVARLAIHATLMKISAGPAPGDRSASQG